ncbi:unnamed protein product [Phytomonas sp. EM1]|nr:unnamed protein product [Phytomonas sp. EM1]|eukprot:CCW59784.1 unnamed protein product [Phytomonas sp. isolate EM1]
MTKSLYYCDDGGGWNERKPSNLPAFSPKTITLCNVDLDRADLAEVDKLNELLTIHTPAIVIAHSVSHAFLTRIKALNTIRKGYALLETNHVTLHEEGTIALLRLGLQWEPTELMAKPEGKNPIRALLQISSRLPGGLMLNITVIHIEHRLLSQRRLQIVGALLKAPSNANESVVSMLISNVADASDYNEEYHRELQTLRANVGFVDMLEEVADKHVATMPWSMFMKSAKFAPVSPFAEMPRGQEPRLLGCSIAQRTANALQTIAIPMPRSAKTGCGKSPTLSAATPNQALADPVILSVEAAKGGGGGGASTTASATTPAAGADLFARLMQSQSPSQPHARWKASNSFQLKGNDAKLSNVEGVLDASALFGSVNEAVEALNTRAFAWPAEYCVVHHTVLCAEGVKHADRQGFRRYAREVKGNPGLAAQIYNALSTYAAGGGGGYAGNHTSTEGSGNGGVAKAWVKPSRAEMEEFNAFQRQLKREEVSRREWHESCCTIVYQLTSSEMNKFNITPQIGLGKDNLKKAVHYLNRAKMNIKDNPLQDYAYDYALLFSVERQGYWLLAATHVPCDIVACRMVA